MIYEPYKRKDLDAYIVLVGVTDGWVMQKWIGMLVTLKFQYWITNNME